MMKNLKRTIVGLMLCGGLAVGVFNGTGCDDDDDGEIVVGGTGGFGGFGFGTGGGGGTAATDAGLGDAGDAGGVRVFTVQLTGAQEVPANSSTATSTTTVTFDPATRTVSVSGTFTGLGSPASAAHIHMPALAGTNAAIVVPLTVPAATSGSISGSQVLDVAQVAELLTGLAYVNIHSTNFPNGEIRGQIQP